MTQVQVFDPALCCSSGVCGTDVDQNLVDFSANVDWAKQQGASIERFNLAQQPMAFADSAAVKDLLQKSGEAALPVLLVDGQVMLSGSYPTREVLAQWLGITLAPSIFSAQVAELVAIGAVIASNCEPCFKYHFDAARQLDVSDADMLQAVNLAQQVKESPAKSVLDLAQKFLQAAAPAAKDAAPSAGCCGETTTFAASSTGCCGATTSNDAKPAAKCC